MSTETKILFGVLFLMLIVSLSLVAKIGTNKAPSVSLSVSQDVLTYEQNDTVSVTQTQNVQAVKSQVVETNLVVESESEPIQLPQEPQTKTTIFKIQEVDSIDTNALGKTAYIKETIDIRIPQEKCLCSLIGCYKTKANRVIDGDTIDSTVDLGFGISKSVRIRLADIDAPEVRGEERAEGIKSKEFLNQTLKNGKHVTLSVHGFKKDKYGRYLGIFYVDGTNINQLMLKEGYAEPYIK